MYTKFSSLPVTIRQGALNLCNYAYYLGSTEYYSGDFRQDAYNAIANSINSAVKDVSFSEYTESQFKELLNIENPTYPEKQFSQYYSYLETLYDIALNYGSKAKEKHIRLMLVACDRFETYHKQLGIDWNENDVTFWEAIGDFNDYLSIGTPIPEIPFLIKS